MKGTINFVDNSLDQMTGTLRIARPFSRIPKAASLPGHVRPHSRPRRHAARGRFMVSERALGSDQGQRFLYVVGKDNKVAYRRVTVGRSATGCG